MHSAGHRITRVHHFRSSNDTSDTASDPTLDPASNTTISTDPSASSDDAAATPPGPDQVTNLFQLIVLLIVLFFFLTTLPRLIARFRQPGAWGKGWILRSRVPAAARLRRNVSQPIPAAHIYGRRPTIKKEHLNVTENGHSIIQRVARRGPTRPPAHVPAWSTMFHPISAVFKKPVFGSSMAVGQVIVLIIYAAGLSCAAFINCSGSDILDRAGYLVVGQLPLMVLLGSKNSLLAFLIGRSYEQVNWIHRWIGRLVFVCALVHAIGFVVLWYPDPTADLTQPVTEISTWITMTGFIMIVLFSLPCFRRSTYQIFIHSHWIGLGVLLIAAPAHASEALPYSIATGIALAVDQVFRLLSSRIVTASLTPLPELRTTRIEIPDLARGWRPGQHIRLRAISKEMGLLSWSEVHPFTIASVEQCPNGEGLVLLVKSAGNWTGRLYEIASRNLGPHYAENGGSTTDVELESFDNSRNPSADDLSKNASFSLPTHHKTAMGSGATMKFIVQGPYGGPPSHAILSSFSSALIIAGGSGVSYGLGVLGSLVMDIEQGCSRTRLIHFVWVVKDSASLVPLLPQLADLQARVDSTPAISLNITVHYTRASTTRIFSTSNASLVPGRPNFGAILGEVVGNTSCLDRNTEQSLNGVAVACCGPLDLVKSVGRAEADVDSTLRKSVGGIEIFEEAFGM